MKTPRIVVCLAALLLAGEAQAQKPCSKAESAAAEKAIDRVLSWPQLYKAWTDYRHCDAGPVDDLYTDALLRLVVDWKDIPTFAAAMEKDPQYKEFVTRHLKSPAAKDDLDSIYSRAKASCPAKQEAFCGELIEIVRAEPPKAKPAPEPAKPAPEAASPAPK
ncbi:MAG: hypothetical protein ACXWG9_09550 [Usitatibacter sp.]